MSATPEPNQDRRRQPAPFDRRALLRLDPMDRINVLRAGIESVALVAIAHAIGRSCPELIDLLQLARPSPVSTPRKGVRLTTAQSERVLAFLRLIERVDHMVTIGSDDSAFDAARWLGDWLARPCPALGGQRPAALTDTLEGYRVLDQLLSQMLSGAYA
ncbi:MbcA/ParS/Xre antitoxin family protein [Aromatoleum evansii]|uniref:MbcA/ParS/Xre antitoxin family protein n=1 Tax=Aromatoleum evansii TaxID=59406 RepID=UPI00145C9078|nr:MbcA/ParS/Xre antitoxin family protein [Aromatoleum evansii]NMG28077.1 DUF2384 domain-containing protein [Aromatoleum evansii]